MAEGKSLQHEGRLIESYAPLAVEIESKFNLIRVCVRANAVHLQFLITQ